MKRLTIVILCVTLLFSLAGCASETKPHQKPAAFYYRTAEVTYDGRSSIIRYEERESAGYESDIPKLLNLYFRGPSSENLRSPFPKNLEVVGYSTLGPTVLLELSDEFTQLSGIDLSIASACIACTILSLVEQERVQISVADTPLDGQSYIMLDRSSVLLLDLMEDTATTDATTDETTQ